MSAIIQWKTAITKVIIEICIERESLWNTINTEEFWSGYDPEADNAFWADLEKPKETTTSELEEVEIEVCRYRLRPRPSRNSDGLVGKTKAVVLCASTN